MFSISANTPGILAPTIDTSQQKPTAFDARLETLDNVQKHKLENEQSANSNEGQDAAKQNAFTFKTPGGGSYTW
ncbi:hypothetical protein HBO04_20575 [Pseudomonas proteolytica]|uniref:hypothetical protein n=1 Tax=Pseudomonas proteolytica TaxID=219574 RepID=UPI001473CBCB|nr:hypothetical protein [Pseudomonas proteolytica]MBC3336708.1 hypothetical protein [Pseudomonas proteolytica]NMZ02519.1 hypothetical protein [Pseudomonas proteolytica]